MGGSGGAQGRSRAQTLNVGGGGASGGAMGGGGGAMGKSRAQAAAGGQESQGLQHLLSTDPNYNAKGLATCSRAALIGGRNGLQFMTDFEKRIHTIQELIQSQLGK